MFRKRATPAPGFHVPAMYNPMTGKFARLGPPTHWLPTELNLKTSGSVPTSTNFTAATSAGLCWKFSQGLSLEEAKIELLALSAYSDPSVKLLASGLWDIWLEWTVGQYQPPSISSGNRFPLVCGANYALALSNSYSNGMGNLEGTYSFFLLDSTSSFDVPQCLIWHSHYLLQAPAGTTLSAVASIAAEYPQAGGTGSVTNAKMRLRLLTDD